MKKKVGLLVLAGFILLVFVLGLYSVNGQTGNYPGPAGGGTTSGGSTGGTITPNQGGGSGSFTTSGGSLTSGCTEISSLQVPAYQKSGAASFAVPPQCVSNSCDLVLVGVSDNTPTGIGSVRFTQLSGGFEGIWTTIGGSGKNGDGQREVIASWSAFKGKGNSPAIYLVDDTSSESAAGDLNLVYGTPPGTSPLLSPSSYGRSRRSPIDFKVLLC